MLAALLIKEGFVKPAFLFPNLSPDDDGMAQIEARYKAAMSSRSGPNNALMNSVLVDDDAPAGASDKPAEEADKPIKQTEQKIDLLQALVSIGEVSFAMNLLAQYPWILAAYPNIAQLVLRNIDYCIDPVYRRCTEVDDSADSTPTGTYDLQVVPTLSWPVPRSTPTKTYEFFYSSWNERLEQWETIEDVYTKGEHWLRLLSGLGGKAPGPMTKICKIMNVYFDELRENKLAAGENVRPTNAEIAPWMDLIRGTLLPALSVTDDLTTCFDDELEHTLNEFSWETLACLIGEWRDNTCNLKSRAHLPPAANATTKATRDIKQALSRITAAASNPNAPTPASQAASDRGPARALAKYGRANPAALWTVSNSQVMAYGAVGNIGEYIIEVGRYTSSLSKEVAVFTWVDTLSSSATNPRAIESKCCALSSY
jgi:THO complex subunit 2